MQVFQPQHKNEMCFSVSVFVRCLTRLWWTSELRAALTWITTLSSVPARQIDLLVFMHLGLAFRANESIDILGSELVILLYNIIGVLAPEMDVPSCGSGVLQLPDQSARLELWAVLLKFPSASAREQNLPESVVLSIWKMCASIALLKIQTPFVSGTQ